MVVAETAAAFTSLRSALDIAKAMINLRDAEAFRGRAIELQGLLAETLGEVIETRQAHSANLDRIGALEAELANLKAWDAEKQHYELKPAGRGCVAYMLKPAHRGSEPPHWLCPNCYANGKKSFFQTLGPMVQRTYTYRCGGCDGVMTTEQTPHWD